MKKRHCTNEVRAERAEDLKKTTNVQYRYDAFANLTDMEVLNGNITKPQTKAVIRKIRSESRAANTLTSTQHDEI